jgi:multidrug resistance protein, MATE family
MAFMVPLGLSTRGRLDATRVVVPLALLVRNLWGYAYSDEEEVVRYIARMMPLLAPSIVLDCLQGVLSATVLYCIKHTHPTTTRSDSALHWSHL